MHRVAAPFAGLLRLADEMNSPAVVARKSLHYLLESLAPKERLYVEARVRGSVPVVAARLAGYADPDEAARELESREMVRAAVEYGIRVAAYELKITRDDVVNGLLDAIRSASTAGEQIAGWKEIGKLLGHYAPTKSEVSVEHKAGKEAVKKLSDEQLAKMAAVDAEFVRLEDDEEEGENEYGVPGREGAQGVSGLPDPGGHW